MFPTTSNKSDSLGMCIELTVPSVVEFISMKLFVTENDAVLSDCSAYAEYKKMSRFVTYTQYNRKDILKITRTEQLERNYLS